MNQPTCSYMPVTADGSMYCLDNQIVKSIAIGDDCQRLDEVGPNGLVGEMRYSQQDIPVLRLRSILELESTPQPRREHLVVMEIQKNLCGLLVDDVQRPQEVPGLDLLPLPVIASNSVRRHFAGVARLRESNSNIGALILSHEGLVGIPSTVQEFTRPEIEGSTRNANVDSAAGKIIVFDFPATGGTGDTFSIGFSATEVLEIIPATELMPVPLAADNFFGLLPWRNQFVPVIDLAEHMEFGRTPFSGRRRIAIVRSPKNHLLGFYSSEDVCSLRLPIEASPCQLPAEHAKHMIGAYTRTDGIPLYLPSSKSLCAAPQTAA